MIVFVDDDNRIKAVNETDDETLRELEINDDSNPFKDWSTAKICSYKVEVQDGYVVMMTPYVPSSELGYIETLGKMIDDLASKHETNVANIDYIAMETGVDLDMEV